MAMLMWRWGRMILSDACERKFSDDDDEGLMMMAMREREKWGGGGGDGDNMRVGSWDSAIMMLDRSRMRSDWIWLLGFFFSSPF